MDKKLKLRREDGFNYYSVDIEAKGVHLRVGLDEEVHDLVKQKEFTSERFKTMEKFKSLSKQMEQDNYSIGQDGVVVKYRNY
jgi:hypothetical protein